MHLYTASGAAAGILALCFAAGGDFRSSFLAMAAAVAIDASDGPLARAFRVRERIPWLDGALLDNLVDYLNYVVAPVFLMLRAGILNRGPDGVMLAALVMVASALGFARVDAKTADNYFLGFPSYWNVIALYLYCGQLPVLWNGIIVAFLAVMVLVPVRYIYPNRTEALRPLTMAVCAIWAITTGWMILTLPAPSPLLMRISLFCGACYLAASFFLEMRAARAARDRQARARLGT